jgi:hypothetical protein
MNRTRRGSCSGGSKGQADALSAPLDLSDFEAAFEKLRNELPETVMEHLRPLRNAFEDQQTQIELLRQENAEFKTKLDTLVTSVDRLQQQEAASAPKQQQQQKALQKQVETLDRSSKQRQLLLLGLAEGSSTGKRLLDVVTDLIPAAKGTDVTVKRIGSPRGSKPRPVLLSVSSRAQKHAVLKASRVLRQAKLYLDSYLTHAQLKARKELRHAYRYLKAESLRPFWREERLYYTFDGRLYQHRMGDTLPGIVDPIVVDDPDLIITMDE